MMLTKELERLGNAQQRKRTISISSEAQCRRPPRHHLQHRGAGNEQKPSSQDFQTAQKLRGLEETLEQERKRNKELNDLLDSVHAERRKLLDSLADLRIENRTVADNGQRSRDIEQALKEREQRERRRNEAAQTSPPGNPKKVEVDLIRMGQFVRDLRQEAQLVGSRLTKKIRRLIGKDKDD